MLWYALNITCLVKVIKGSVDLRVCIYKSLRKLCNSVELLFVSRASPGYCVNTLRLIFWERLGVTGQRRKTTATLMYLKA